MAMLRPSYGNNPLQRTMLRGNSFIASLQSHVQSLRRTRSQLLGGPKHKARRASQQIAPWSKLLEGRELDLMRGWIGLTRVMLEQV